MIVFKFNEVRFIIELRMTTLFSNTNTPVHIQINQILTSIKTSVTNIKVKEQIDV